MKFALIGCGRIATNHIKAVLDNQLDLVAVCDVKPEVMEILLERHGLMRDNSIKRYTDYKTMVEEQDIDLVAIATESGYHAEIAIYCMEKGKHVIVEKPMALSTEDADKMIEVAHKNEVKLCVAHQNRFNAPIQKLRKAIEEERFGRLIAGNARILWNRDENYYRQAPWRGTYKLDGGCLMNQCIHNIDLLQWMLGGDIKWVHGDVSNNIHPYIEAEDYGAIQIKFKNGAVGNVEGTVCIYPKNLEETLTIIGEKGTVIIGGLAVNKVETWRFSDGIDSEEQVKSECNDDVDNVYGTGHTPLYRDMIESVEHGREPYINGESGKKAMEIILATYKSNLEEKRVMFPLYKIESESFGK